MADVLLMCGLFRLLQDLETGARRLCYQRTQSLLLPMKNACLLTEAEKNLSM